MLIIIGVVKVESVAEVEKARAGITAMVKASNAEPGCILYAFSQDLGDPTIIRITEKWKDQAALDAHFATPHMATFIAGLADVKIDGMTTKLYDASNERPVRG